ncbi:hypothetical protein FACS1894189_4230 [Planctomycetales bacterium]|nr:hypothetical protein FACS1894189_4230 [Planctomycetales bacterium]
MQRLFWILTILNVLLIVAAVFWLPEMIATHFDLAGLPNGWMRKVEFIALMGIIVLLAIVYWVPISFLFKICSPEFFSIPNHNYWTQDDNITQLRAILLRIWWETGCVVMTVPIWTSIEIVYANSKAAPTTGNEIWFGGLLIIALTVSIIKCFLALRIPKEKKMINVEEALANPEETKETPKLY